MLRNKISAGYGYILRIVIGTIVIALMLLSVGVVAEGKTWQVLAGGETPDMALQGLGFYPGVITVNEGDMVNWTLRGSIFHTVSFLSGGPIPSRIVRRHRCLPVAQFIMVQVTSIREFLRRI